MLTIKQSHPDLSDFEIACKLLDELICLKFQESLDYNAVRDALEMIAQARKCNENFPITLWLIDKLREKNLLQ